MGCPGSLVWSYPQDSKEQRAWTLDLLIPVPGTVWRGFLVWFQQHFFETNGSLDIRGISKETCTRTFSGAVPGRIASLSACIKAEKVATRTRGEPHFVEILPCRSIILPSIYWLVLTWETGSWILASWSSLARTRVDLDTRSLRTHIGTHTLHKKAPPHYSCYPLTGGDSSSKSPRRQKVSPRWQTQPSKEIT